MQRHVRHGGEGLTPKDIAREIQARIGTLTMEIADWTSEFGDDALLRLYEERARWGEIAAQMAQHCQHTHQGKETPYGTK